MLIDNAGWHAANDLRVPPNITPCTCPPLLARAEHHREGLVDLRDRYLSGRLFGGTRTSADDCCDAWNSLLAEAGRIRSLNDFE
jgi:hypothetical protein